MKILFDNNVILDAVTARLPFFEDAKRLFDYASEGKIKNFMSANSMTDIFYVLRKMSTAEKAKDVIWSLINGFDIISVNVDDCKSALMLNMSDFEDALIVICGKKAKVDYIVTRDEEFLKIKSPIPTISIKDLLILLDNRNK